MGARTVLWIGVCMWSHVCTRGSTPSPPILGKNGGVYPYCWVGGWKKWGPTWEKKGGATRKNPRPMGENGGGPWREGKKSPPRHLLEPMERARRYGARRDASGRGDGNSSIQHAPVALRYLKSLSGGIGEYLGAPGCTHTTTHPPVCTCGSPCLQATGYRPVPSGASRLPILAAGNPKFPNGNPFAMRARELRRACETTPFAHARVSVSLPWEFPPRFPHPLWPVPPLAVCNVSRHRLPWWIR